MKNIYRILTQSLLFFSFIVPFFAAGQNNLIPNTLDCSGTRPPFEFNTKQAWVSNTNNVISTCTTPLVGDIDGDGVTEVFALGTNRTTLYILDGRDGSTITTLTIDGYANSGVTSSILLCKINGVGAIFNAGSTTGMFTLWTVSSAPGARPITFQQQWSVAGGTTTGGTMPVVTDFDGDGIPEFISRGKIIDSQNGAVLETLAYGSISVPFDASFHIALDLDNDGLPEIVAGTEVYKFSRNTTPHLQLWRSLNNVSTSIAKQDGLSMGADINQDGNVDLVFVDGAGTTIYVWTPLTNTLVGTITVPGSTNYHSYPFVGDIDGVVISGKKYPEICINKMSTLYAYTFNGTSFVQKWSMSHNDTSGATSLTLFDFNNDGIVELVYRDEDDIRIFDGSGAAPVEKFSQRCGSVTCDETPIIADVNGDGSADIIVTGHPYEYNRHPGEVMVFEGATSKWASSPNVWNQQMYSPLHVNLDLSIPDTIKSVNITFTRPDNSTVQFYNGGPMQAPFISEETYLPVDLSPDVYVVSGNITINSTTSVTLTVTFGNQGLIMAPASTPIRYYKNAMAAGNVIGGSGGTLGVNLAPGQTHTITKTITGLSPMPSQFYVRILDDGTNFPALGAYSDCNLTNNHKSFGTLELLKTVNATTACVDGISIFNIRLVNNTHQTSTPQTFNNIQLIDSLGNGWEFLSAAASTGTLSAYNSTDHKIQWSLSALVPGDTAFLTIIAKSISAGAIRNSAWVESVNGTTLGREIIEAYVVVSSETAMPAATISPASATICPPQGVTLTASVPGKLSYQWYLNNMEIAGAVQQTYTATTAGSYTVTYYDIPCASQMSSPAIVAISPALDGGTIAANQSICYNTAPSIITSLAAASGGSGTITYQWQSSPDNSTWTNIGGATAITYAPPALTATAYYRRVANNASCGSANSNVITVTVMPLPEVSVLGSTGICVGTTTQLLPTTGGTWISNNPATAAVTNGGVVTGIAAGTATFTFTEAATGCSATTAAVTVGTFPTVNDITGENTVCTGESIQLANATAGGVWSVNNLNVSINSSTANPVTVTGISLGDSFITYTVGSGVCQGKETLLIKVIPATSPVIRAGFER